MIIKKLIPSAFGIMGEKIFSISAGAKIGKF